MSDRNFEHQLHNYSAEQHEQESVDRNIGFLINDAARQMRTNYDRRMKELGLTRSQWWVLTHLFFNEGLSQTSLSEILEIERATLGRLLDRLEAKGWIERRTVAKDRRVKQVFLAQAVEPLLRTMRVLAAEVRTEATAGLSEEEQELLIATLTKLKNNLINMADTANSIKQSSKINKSVEEITND